MTKASPGHSPLISALALLILVLTSSTGYTETCTVPGGYATIQAAVANSKCTTIVLAAGSFRESLTIGRDLALQGAPSFATTIEGQLIISAATTNVQLTDLVVDTSVPGLAGCYTEAIAVRGEAVVSALRLDVRNSVQGICTQRIFTDGFESGDTSIWSTALP